MWTWLNGMLHALKSITHTANDNQAASPVGSGDVPSDSMRFRAPAAAGQLEGMGEISTLKRKFSDRTAPIMPQKRLKCNETSLELPYAQDHKQSVFKTNNVMGYPLAVSTRPSSGCSSPTIASPKRLSSMKSQAKDTKLALYYRPSQYLSRSPTPSLAHDLPSSDFDYPSSSPAGSSTPSPRNLESQNPAPLYGRQYTVSVDGSYMPVCVPRPRKSHRSSWLYLGLATRTCTTSMKSLNLGNTIHHTHIVSFS